MKQFSNGRNGWAMLIVGVAIWDILVEDTLSEAFGRGANGKGAPALIVTWAVLTAHLFDVLPSRYDPFNIFLRTAKQLGAAGGIRRR